MWQFDGAALADEEWELLDQGVLQWQGPAVMGDGLAGALGFPADLRRRERELERLSDLARERRVTTVDELVVCLTLTEVAFGSVTLGCALDWAIAAGEDHPSLVVLRRLQRKVSSLAAGMLPLH